MSRRNAASKRKVLPDALYGDIQITRFINQVMRSGKKSVAEKIVYQAFEIAKNRQKSISNEVIPEFFNGVLENLRPLVEVKSRRIGGATYQVPIEVRLDRGITLSMRWLIDAAKARREKSMPERLANEMLEVSEKRGAAMKKREDTHRMAEANKAFSHYRF